MKFYHKLYVGMHAKEQKRKIIHKAKHAKPQPGVYFVTLPVNGLNNLEIYPSWVFLQPYYRKKEILVLGISVGKDEAVQLVEEILMDCYHQTGQFQVGDYISDKK